MHKIKKVKFNNKVYITGNKSGSSLGTLCFAIAKEYLFKNQELTYEKLCDMATVWRKRKGTFISYDAWKEKNDHQKKRYFNELIEYNGQKLYFTNQWGDSIINMIKFAKEERYNIKILDI